LIRVYTNNEFFKLKIYHLNNFLKVISKFNWIIELHNTIILLWLNGNNNDIFIRILKYFIVYNFVIYSYIILIKIKEY